MTPTQYFNQYLKDTGKKPDSVTYSGELIFDDTGFIGSEQVRMVLNGQKKAAFTAFDYFDINLEKIPVAGSEYIVEDTSERPCGIVRVNDVKVLPFSEISWELAQLSGEDENLEEWRERNMELFLEEGDLSGFEFNESSLVVVEIFDLIYSKPAE